MMHQHGYFLRSSCSRGRGGVKAGGASKSAEGRSKRRRREEKCVIAAAPEETPRATGRLLLLRGQRRRREGAKAAAGASTCFHASVLLACLLAAPPALWLLLARRSLLHGAVQDLAASAWRAAAPLGRALLCGAGVSALTGALVYWDSADPGENPRSPLSGRNSVGRGVVRCHLAYLVAVVNGVASAAAALFVAAGGGGGDVMLYL